MTKYNVEKFLQDLENLVNIDSHSSDFEGMEKVVAYIEKEFQTPMWHISRPDCGVGCAKPLQIANTADENYDVVLCCHIDTVFPKGTVAKRPYSVKENIAYGPGVSDMKSCCLQSVYVAKALEEASALDKLKICLAFNTEEEVGSSNVRPWLEKLGKNTKYCLVMEAARANGARVLERKGVQHYVIDFKGKAAHAGNNHADGRSAINEMAYWILELAKLTNYETGLTVNTGVVAGGQSYNAVADNAHMDVDVRIVDMKQVDIVEAAIQELLEHAKKAEILVDVKHPVNQPPMASTPETAGLVAIIDEASQAYGMSTEWVKAGGASDGNYMSGAGACTVDGIGPVGAGGHSEAEYLELDSIEPSLHVLEKVLLDLQAKLYK